jgi:hypothetical protein
MEKAPLISPGLLPAYLFGEFALLWFAVPPNTVIRSGGDSNIAARVDQTFLLTQWGIKQD